MKAGDIVVWGDRDRNPKLNGTPDGKLFYKVLGDDADEKCIRLALFHVGRRRLEEEKELSVYLGQEMSAQRSAVRLATQEEKEQLAVARFME